MIRTIALVTKSRAIEPVGQHRCRSPAACVSNNACSKGTSVRVTTLPRGSNRLATSVSCVPRLVLGVGIDRNHLDLASPTIHLGLPRRSPQPSPPTSATHTPLPDQPGLAQPPAAAPDASRRRTNGRRSTPPARLESRHASVPMRTDVRGVPSFRRTVRARPRYVSIVKPLARSSWRVLGWALILVLAAVATLVGASLPLVHGPLYVVVGAPIALVGMRILLSRPPRAFRRDL